MYSDFAPFSIVGMSSSDPFAAKTDQKKRPESSSVSSSADPPPLFCESTATTSSFRDRETTAPSLGGLSATSGEGDGGCDDGFRTPTSSDQRIPEIRPCPPAPRKPSTGLKTRPAKRKSSPDDIWSRHRRAPLLLDLSNEVESMFPPILRANLKCKIKKARSV